ncbi:MAG: ABC transporter permease [Synergistaceae bacterium]|jgi:simple sugar transport system permease protein|nr:ABC transporter permease [Synergistaceae bacterium]
MFKNSLKNTAFTIAVSFLLGAVVIWLLGYSPIEAYKQLFRGAFVGKLNFGGTLERFVPLMLTALAFAVSAKVAVFNVGVEGELYLGAICAAWAGFALKGVPAIIHVPLCIAVGMAAGGAWAVIPAALKAYWKVNEVCVTILMNYVATYITSYLVAYPLSGKTGVPQTPGLEASARLFRIMRPSRANIGIFIAIGFFALICFILTRTTWGYRIKQVGENPRFAEYAGIRSKAVIIWGMIMSGSLGGLAGSLEVMGIYGYFLDGFSPGIAFDGMLASLIAKNDLKMIPVLAFFLAVLKAGALGMERYTGVPKALVDSIIAVFILIAAMEGLSIFKGRNT